MPFSRYELNTNESDSNVFKIGDWVYCEFEPTQPYSIRRIEELVQKPDGSVEAKLRCAFRRTDIPTSLLLSLEKRYSQYFNKDSSSNSSSPQFTLSNASNSSNSKISTDSQESTESQKTYSYLPSTEHLSSLEIYRLKHRELFYSRYFETDVPVKGLFKGKLELNLHMPDIHSCFDYMNETDDKFFYQITYDQNQKVLSVDRGQIRVGFKFQVGIPRRHRIRDDETENNKTCDTLLLDGTRLSKLDCDKYVQKVCRKAERQQPNLLNQRCVYTRMSHDNILFDAIWKLHESGYEFKQALNNTCTDSSLSVREELIEINVGNGCDTRSSFSQLAGNVWTHSDIEMFKAAIDKLGKNFFLIRKEFLPNKTTSQIVEFYYNEWKRTEEYIQLRQTKRARKQSNKLLEVKVNCCNSFDSQQDELSQDLNQNRILCVSCQCFKLVKNFSKSKHLKTMKNSYEEPQTTRNFDSYDTLDNKTLDFRNDYTPIDPKNSKSSMSSKISYQPVAYQQYQQNASENLCDDCLIYLKKYAAYKYNYIYSESSGGERPGPEQRLERLEASRSQLFTCMVDTCRRTFKKKSELAGHSVISHALILKKLVRPACPMFNEMHNFCFKPTLMTKAIRCLADSKQRSSELKFSKKLARRPVKTLMGCNQSIIEKLINQPETIFEIIDKQTGIGRINKSIKNIKRQPQTTQTPNKRNCLADIHNTNKIFKKSESDLKSNTVKNDISIVRIATTTDDSVSFPTPLPSPVLSPSFKVSSKKRIMKKTERKQRRREILLNWRLKKKAKQVAEATLKTSTELTETVNVEEKVYSDEANINQLKDNFFETKLVKEEWSFKSTHKIRNRRKIILTKRLVKILARNPFKLLKNRRYSQMVYDQKFEFLATTQGNSQLLK